MRCWRIMTVDGGGGGRDNDLIIGGGGDQLTGDEHDVCPQQKLELSFEYLMNTGELRWVTVVSTQAILMSLCLQSMVEELLRLRSGAKIKTVRNGILSIKPSVSHEKYVFLLFVDAYSTTDDEGGS